MIKGKETKMRRSKIFGIGLSKTGTSSLTEALEILGFSAVHYPTSLHEIEIYGAAADLLVADTFEMLDTTFRGVSLFTLFVNAPDGLNRVGGIGEKKGTLIIRVEHCGGGSTGQ